jgi:predicted acyl esterase
MLSYAAPDGWDTLDWITAQPWSNGNVATYGCSSSAENQLKLAAQNHPAHKAMIAYSAGVGVAEAGAFHEQGNFWRGGAWQQGWFDYFITETQKDWPQLPAGMTDEERERASAVFMVDNQGEATRPEDFFDKVRMHLPMVDMAKAAGAPRTEFEEYLARGPAAASAWSVDRVTNADRIRVPGLWAEALYDISARSTVAFFDKTRVENAAGHQAIIITNGRHCAFGRETANQKIGDRPIGDARYEYVARQIAWLNRWMKDDAAAPTPAHPVTVYMAGINLWTDFDSAPRRIRSIAYVLLDQQRTREHAVRRRRPACGASIGVCSGRLLLRSRPSRHRPWRRDQRSGLGPEEWRRRLRPTRHRDPPRRARLHQRTAH